MWNKSYIHKYINLQCIMCFWSTSWVGIWSRKTMLIPCINIVYRWICFKSFLIIDGVAMTVSLYWHGTGRISDCLNILLPEVLGWAPAIVLMIFFCKVEIFQLLEVIPKNYFIFYNRMKVCVVNWFKSANVTDMDHQPNGITCATYLRNRLLSMVLPVYLVINL